MKKGHIGISVFCLILFGLLCYFAHEFPVFPGDHTTTLWLQGITLPCFAPAMRAISFLTGGVSAAVIVILVLIALLLSRRKLEAILISSLTSSGALLNWLVKLAVDRPRPGREFIPAFGENTSFPSGHATYAVVLFGFLFYLTPRLFKRPAAIWISRSVLLLLIILVGASRVYLEAHWPSDILGSLFFGVLLLFTAIILYNYYLKRGREKLEVPNA